MKTMEKMQVHKSKKVGTAVVIGRWQIPHLGHQALFDRALELGEQVVVVIGSAYRARDSRNPFTAEERQKMILRAIPAEEHSRVKFAYVRDYYDNSHWIEAVTQLVKERSNPENPTVSLVGFKKDETSQYLDWFPSWTSSDIQQTRDLDATSLRNVYFSDSWEEAGADVIEKFVAPGVLAYLKAWAKLPEYRYVAEYTKQVQAYRKKYPGPYYLTADALVNYGGKVLLIQRGGNIGRGQWALPGGFVNPGEQFRAAALRELREETQLGFTDAAMLFALKDSDVFDHPLRSVRAHIITRAFYFEFKGNPDRTPEIKASDDAQAAGWFTFEEVAKLEDQLFEDHAAIIRRFIRSVWE